MKFSDRKGITQPKSIIQINGIDESLRNKLWNIIIEKLITPLESESLQGIKTTEFYTFFVSLWHHYFEQPIDTMPINKHGVINVLRKYFFSCEWYEVYNLIEFIYKRKCPINKESFKKGVNNVLASCLAGYRFIENELVPISDDIEIKEIEESLEIAKKQSLVGVKTHLESALRILSNKEDPDYKNVIKESILAVESISQKISGDKKASLGKALSKIKDKIEIHPALVKGFKMIYGYTSDSDGIRHALLEKEKLDVEDAKYMLISCCAFINYLIVKALKANEKIS